MTTIFEPKLVDAFKQSVDHPKTFAFPSGNLSVGDFAKISDSHERFWVKVVTRDNNTYVGVITNQLISGQKYNTGDKIRFERKNVYDILKKKTKSRSKKSRKSKKNKKRSKRY